jgi:hypothetical protein
MRNAGCAQGDCQQAQLPAWQSFSGFLFTYALLSDADHFELDANSHAPPCLSFDDSCKVGICRLACAQYLMRVCHAQAMAALRVVARDQTAELSEPE